MALLLGLIGFGIWSISSGIGGITVQRELADTNSIFFGEFKCYVEGFFRFA